MPYFDESKKTWQTVNKVYSKSDTLSILQIKIRHVKELSMENFTNCKLLNSKSGNLQNYNKRKYVHYTKKNELEPKILKESSSSLSDTLLNLNSKPDML